ncbi:MAG: DUF6843 domain-containing protein [Bacillota bacterium]
MTGCVFQEEEKYNNIFLIPEGFDGAIFVFHDVPDKPKFEKEGNFSIIPVEIRVSETLAGSGMTTYGVAFTSEPVDGSVFINDKYYYVDDDGNRQKLNEYCTSSGGGGGLSGDNEGGIGVSYSVTFVTNKNCNESFYLYGRERHRIQRHEILKEWGEIFGNINVDGYDDPLM